MTAVLCVTNRLRTLWSACKSSCSADFTGDEPHCRPLSSLGDRFSIPKVILVTLEVWFDVLCRQEPYLMA